MAKTSTTPWGAATIVDEVRVQQRVGDKRFASVVELLEARGERLVRFAYATGGTARRGPVTLRARDLERLRVELRVDPGCRRGEPVRLHPGQAFVVCAFGHGPAGGEPSWPTP